MKAIISTTYDDQYLFFLPITTWLWNKLGVDVICFMPYKNTGNTFMLVSKTLTELPNKRDNWIYNFDCPEHKEATYAQCSRLYAACLDLPEGEIIITSDVDMGLFKIPRGADGNIFTVLGSDLTPESQVPMCYLSGTVADWRDIFKINGRPYQQCLDDLLGHIEAQHYRGNFWSKDQEEAANKLNEINKIGVSVPKDIRYVHRARPGTQFASRRIDRDDAYYMDRLSPDIIDYHMHRPGYTDDNFNKILSVIKYFYPNEDLTWMKEYQQQYKALL